MTERRGRDETTGQRPLLAGLRALRRFARPFVLIQLGAVGLVLAYRSSATVRQACLALGEVKQAGGLAFAALACAIAGALIPELAKWITRRGGGGTGRGRGADVAFNFAFFAVNGMVIDLFYRLETIVFGPVATPVVVAKKAAFDQFVFTPLWLPIIIAIYAWRGNGFRLAGMGRALGPWFYPRRVLPLLLPNWCFWIPMTSIIYALPVPLQFLLFALALGAWSLIMVFIASGEGSTERGAPTGEEVAARGRVA
jgi:hypothetical protein